LVDDGVDADGGFSGLAVTNHKFALSATDWDHRVNGFDSGLERFLHWLSFDNARSENFNESKLVGRDRTKTVKWLA
jgi:hypothetical protein